MDLHLYSMHRCSCRGPWLFSAHPRTPWRNKSRSCFGDRQGWKKSSICCSTHPNNGSMASASTIVWLKHDLRLDDHPGFITAARTSPEIVPFFCIAPELYVHLLRTPYGVEGLLGALASLRGSLQSRGCDLVVRTGSLPGMFNELTQQVDSSIIMAEEEVEHRWLQAIKAVAQSLPSHMRLHYWKASLFEDEPYNDNFRQFARLRGPAVPRLEAAWQLPSLPAGIDPGPLPLPADLRKMLREADAALLHPEVLAEAQGVTEAWPPTEVLPIAQQLACGGEAAALPALRAYLRCRQRPMRFTPGPSALPNAASSSGRVDEEELAQKLKEAVDRYETPAAPLGSFPALFQQALSLGLLSRRRVFQEAQQLLGSSPWSPQRLLGGNAAVPARAAVAAAESADFHWHLARADRERRRMGWTQGAPQHWRWRGHMIEYCASVPEEQGVPEVEGAPAILLVHGFGAFGEQWRGQLSALAAQGYRVYAPTIPGFGRSEKPALSYTQGLWQEFLRDFVVEVVRCPVVVAGNSIGGYLAACLAGGSPRLVRGLVLVNSAGKIVPDFTPDQAALDGAAGSMQSGAADASGAAAVGPPFLVADVVSRALFLYLERTIAQTLVKVYPVAPELADSWLCEEIARAATDPGAVAVFRSVFYLPKPLALNYLVAEKFGGPALVLQGAKDPLNDAKGRAAALKAACPNVQVHLLDGGHCPHDEVPEAFNAAFLSFFRQHTVETTVVGRYTVAV